ncbi:hypothetical protein [Pleionea sediminis]|uniref:hypothetical protein n=1 Tax=Pleionea sediminis TaxID=2569479 RepID=UPI001186BB59|nr:hypothetical protein [Pleionea sediminis]
MASWINEPCLEILRKINDVPNDDGRENKQLKILINGFADLNKEMMRRAAENARAQFSELSTEEEPKAPEKKQAKKPEEPSKAQEDLDDSPDLDDFDSFDEELDMIEQTLIRSIGD